MKNKLHLLLRILIGLIIISCNKDISEQSQLIGTWRLKSIEFNGIDAPASGGGECYSSITFNNDFSGSITTLIATTPLDLISSPLGCGNYSEFTWDYNEYLILNDVATIEILVLNANFLEYKLVKINDEIIPESEQSIRKYER